MASVIRIKRSSVSGNPSTLAAGELAYSALTDNGSNGGDRLYVGIGTETNGNAANHFVIGGKYFTDKIDSATSANTADEIVQRDSSGNFAAGTITADISYNTSQTVGISGAVAGTATVTGNGNYTVSVTQQNDSVTLGTHTTGDYVATLADAGNGNIVVVGSGEGAAATVDLSTTGVTAGTFGSATEIPAVTVDTYGRITGVTTNTVATDLGIAGDNGTDTISLLTDTFTVSGDTHVSTSVASDTVTISVDATDANTASTIVARDSSGNFTAGTITANLTGNVTGNVNGDVTSTNVAITGGAIDGTTIGATTASTGAFTSFTASTPSFTGDLDMNSNNIANLADPTQAQHAATKAYVDAVKTGLDIKDSVRVATTENITLSNTQTVDGVALTAGDRVLVKNQTNAADNGIYVVQNAAWNRSADADNNPGNEVSGGMFTFVEEGTVNADSGWVLSSVTGQAVLDTDDLTFSQFSGAGQIVAGIAMSKTGNTLDVNVASSGGILVNAQDELELNSTVAGGGLTLTSGVLDVVGTTDRLTVNANSIDIASTYVGQSSITTLGTISTGTWQATVIDEVYGGTGLNSYATGDILYASGADTLATLSAGADGKVLQMNSSGVPTWGDVDGGTY